MRVGLAGIGKMGAAIAARLHESGEELIVWNRSTDKAAATNLPIAANPRRLAEQCDVIISCLSTKLPHRLSLTPKMRWPKALGGSCL